VVDATTQRPLANATVQLGNTPAQTATNAQGQYTLSARVQPGTYTLRFSLVGRGEVTRQVTLGADRNVQVGPVALQESALELEALVVTGTGLPTRVRALGNAVSTVRGEDIAESPATTIDQALAGKVPGAQ
jgi:hypothetical protein